MAADKWNKIVQVHNYRNVCMKVQGWTSNDRRLITRSLLYFARPNYICLQAVYLLAWCSMCPHLDTKEEDRERVRSDPTLQYVHGTYFRRTPITPSCFGPFFLVLADPQFIVWVALAVTDA